MINQPTEWEKILARHTSDRRLITRICRETTHIIIKLLKVKKNLKNTGMKMTFKHNKLDVNIGFLIEVMIV
jgi:hypothetical protein